MRVLLAPGPSLPAGRKAWAACLTPGWRRESTPPSVECQDPARDARVRRRLRDYDGRLLEGLHDPGRDPGIFPGAPAQVSRGPRLDPGQQPRLLHLLLVLSDAAPAGVGHRVRIWHGRRVRAAAAPAPRPAAVQLRVHGERPGEDHPRAPQPGSPRVGPPHLERYG